MIDDREIRDMLQRRADTVPAVPTDTPKAVRRARRRLVMNGALATVAAVAIVVVAFAGVDAIRSAPLPAVRPTPSPSMPDPTPDDGEVVRGWPSTLRNPAGVYSWDGSRCSPKSCNVGFMHNGFGSGDVEIGIQQVPDGGITDGAATTVAGHDGTYARIDPRREWWIVDIEGTTIAIRLEARPGTNEAHLAEAHAIIESMRTEPRDNDLGFRLVFTLTTNDWDSG